MSRLFPVTISMDEEHLDKLDKLAQDNGGNRSQVVRDLIAQAEAQAKTTKKAAVPA